MRVQANLPGLLCGWLVVVSPALGHIPESHPVNMTGSQVIPGPGDPDGVASGAIVYNDDFQSLGWNFTYSGIGIPTAMYIRQGTACQPGPILYDLPLSNFGGPGTLIVIAYHVTEAEILTLLSNRAGYYIEIQTDEFPNGAVRSQLDITVPVECVTTIDVDIKPGSCPNSFNRGSHGVLPVALLGTAELDVTTVDPASIRLARADEVGGSVGPHEGPPGPSTVVNDVGTPLSGATCECHELQDDGTDDLMMHFKTDDVVAALQLDALSAGDLVELVVTGELFDGSEFVGTDCVRLVPPDSQSLNLTVGANVAGAWIDVSPQDLQMDGGGFTVPNFNRAFPESSVVTVTAAPTFGDRTFTGWKINGTVTPDTSVEITMLADETVEAIYAATPFVPATEEWSMIAMAALLLAAGVILVRRRQVTVV